MDVTTNNAGSSSVDRVSLAQRRDFILLDLLLSYSHFFCRFAVLHCAHTVWGKMQRVLEQAAHTITSVLLRGYY